ncbi:unnamed protein product [Pelagomonas calceolata]|uniref:ABC transporter domain-containing protein n=1 Tax=Pelagomonas calceolata TaxID=35677 RepID=A0A8J2SU95_9STRA|nr:unnamed protein product [Pelagomonas calceolata]
MGKGERTLSATKMDQSRIRAEKENVEYVETLGVHWRNLSVHFKDVQALAPCSGDVEAGQAVALMGPTGCGKTSLLNALARRGPVGGGQVWYGDDLAWSSALKRHVAFVEQDDLVFEGLTVRETLAFSARLRLPAASLKEKLERVDETLKLLRLESCAETPVGGMGGKTISGGERKRLMVGQEMLTRPRLLCCDEPTSGLDSATACVVVEALRDLARERRVAVVASIHQPSSRLFLLFDELLLLRKGGLTYRGSTADAGDAFAGAPFHLPCPAAYSAPDWLMEIVVENKVDSDDEKKRVLDERYGPSTLPPRTEPLRSLRAQKRRQRYAAPLTEQIAVLSRRSWKAVAPKVFKRSSLLLHGGNATLAGLMWWQLGYKEKDVFPRYTLAFAIPIAWIFFPLLDALPWFGAAQNMLRKDLACNAYRLEAWFVVDSTMNLVPMCAQSLMHLTIFYVLAGVSSNPAVWFALYAVLVASFLTFQSIGLMFSAGVSGENVVTVAMIYVTYVFLFTGLFVPVSQTAVPWAVYANPLIYILKLSADAIFGIDRKKFKCGNPDDGTLFPDSCDAGGDGKISVNDIYEEYHLDRFTTGQAIVALFVMFVVARSVAYLLLRRRMKQKERELMRYQDATPTAEEESKEDVAVAGEKA